MNFGEAIEALKEGKKVARAHWGGYWFMTMAHFNHELNDAYPDAQTVMIMAKLKDGSFAPAQPYQGDIIAYDWMVVE